MKNQPPAPKSVGLRNRKSDVRIVPDARKQRPPAVFPAGGDAALVAACCAAAFGASSAFTAAAAGSTPVVAALASIAWVCAGWAFSKAHSTAIVRWMAAERREAANDHAIAVRSLTTEFVNTGSTVLEAERDREIALQQAARDSAMALEAAAIAVGRIGGRHGR